MITDSECESVVSKDSCDQSVNKELYFLRYQNKRLKEELSIYKSKVKTLESENKQLVASKCAMHAKAEVEEEFITNSLLRQISKLEKNMETIKRKFEREEEMVVSDLSHSVKKIQRDKEKLEQSLKSSHQQKIERLHQRIHQLEKMTSEKQEQLDQLRQDKVDIQNTMEREQEYLLNRLWRNIKQAQLDRNLICEKMEIVNAKSSDVPRYFLRKSLPGTSPSMTPDELRKLSFDSLATYVLGLQKDLAHLQSRLSSLDTDKYRAIMNECNIRDDNHWTKKAITFETESDLRVLRSRSTSNRSRESSDGFKIPHRNSNQNFSS